MPRLCSMPNKRKCNVPIEHLNICLYSKRDFRYLCFIKINLSLECYCWIILSSDLPLIRFFRLRVRAPFKIITGHISVVSHLPRVIPIYRRIAFHQFKEQGERAQTWIYIQSNGLFVFCLKPRSALLRFIGFREMILKILSRLQHQLSRQDENKI